MKTRMRIAVVTAVSLLVASCGGGESAERTRNAALPTRTPLPYSCAQLLTDQVTGDTTEIRFSLCEDAEMYSILTPTGVNGQVDDKEVQGGEEIVVPISPEVDGIPTTLIVRTAGALSDDPYHPGVHIYDVSLSRAIEDMVGPDSPLLGSLYPKVGYYMPTPQPWATYRAGFLELPGGPTQYAAYIDELVFKWATFALATCHSTLAQAAMASAGISSSALGEAQINAKRVNDRDWFVSLNALRMYTAGYHPIALCPPGITGVNVIAQGVEQGFSPVEANVIANTSDPVLLLKSLALLKYWGQVVRTECPADPGVTINADAGQIQTWSTQVSDRLNEISEDTKLTSDQRTVALRALRQMDVLDLLNSQRRAFNGVSSCTVIPAGYAVPVKQSVEQVVENVSATLAPAVEVQSQNSSSNSPQALADIVTDAAPAATVAPSQLSWPVAAASATTTIRVGQTVSRAQLVAQSGLTVTSRSTVRLAQIASSKKICTVKSWGVKAARAGTCKVRLSVATKGKKAQTKTVSLTVTK